MFEFAVFTYSLLASFVWTSAERNHRAARPHPPILRHFGYLVVGLSGAVSAILFAIALASLI